jgi:hypothetical protein
VDGTWSVPPTWEWRRLGEVISGPFLIAGRKELSRAADDFFVGPSYSDVGVEAHEYVQVVIHDREPADSGGEDIRKFLQSKFEPFSAVERSFGRRNARRTQRVMQGFQRVTETSTSCERAIVMGGFSQVIGRSHLKRPRLSILRCVSFFSCELPAPGNPRTTVPPVSLVGRRQAKNTVASDGLRGIGRQTGQPFRRTVFSNWLSISSSARSGRLEIRTRVHSKQRRAPFSGAPVQQYHI